MSPKKRRRRPSADRAATPEKPHLSDHPAELRGRAEARLRERTIAETSVAGTPRVFHELEVHQIELEMQNAELHAARNDLEAALEKYTDLYDFAPVGYLTVDESGVILETNLTGAALLGIERSRLINRKMSLFVAPTSRPSFLAYLKDAFDGPEDQTTDALIRKEGGDTFWAGFRATAVDSPSGTRKTCRVAFADVTAQRGAEEAQRGLRALADTNVGLIREIDQRKAVEKALHQSEDQKSRLLEQSHRMQAQLRRLSHRVLGAQEEERKRISRELHDVVAQALVGINVHLAALNSRVAAKPADLKKAIERTQRLVEKAADDVHRFARELRPSALDHLGLGPTLQSLLEEFTKQTGVRVRLTTPPAETIKDLDNAMRTALYRVAQESLSNVARHAQASTVNVIVERLANAVRLTIRDNGKSFQVDRVTDAKRITRLGLIGMRERIEMVGGSFIVKSSPGQGTTVTAEIPFSMRREPRD